MKLTIDALKNRLKSCWTDYVKKIEVLHELDYPAKKIYLCDNVRIRSCKKEPDTVRWIEGFQKQDTVFDVGANVGAYSLIMSVYADKVYAFEPAITNYRLLCKNILANLKKRTITNNVTPFNVSMSGQTKLETLSYVNVSEGKSGHQIGDNLRDGFGNHFVPSYSHHSLCFSIDHFINTFAVEVPAHIKIDVDGNEFPILRGAGETLSNPKLRSLLVEINDDKDARDEMVEFIAGHGLELKSKFSSTPGWDIFNYLFVRSRDAS